ncbi:MAG TPA: topoisomerase DNA-binding C4 zinc finger domain-containing protein, partial [Clostridia bacterium]
VSADITANDYRFTASGRTIRFKGYLAAFSADEQEPQEKPETGDDEDDTNKILPPLEEGDELNLIELKPEQKFTKPPARYTEASLVKAMEEKGIGRPATYTPTILILFTREYCVKEGRYIKPTELGEQVTDMLVKYFPDIMSVDFTANMENMLDEIEEGGKVWQQVIHDFYYGGFERDVKAAMEDSFTLKQPDEQSDVICENCGVNMVIRHGRYGKFLACPNFPKCKNTKSLEENEATGIKCEKCGGDMVVKHSKYGKFLGCSNYPNCDNVKPLEDPNADYGKCPKCGKSLVKRRSKRGEFYACSGYPDCHFISNDVVVDQKCPQCGAHMVLKHYKDGDVIKCSSKECGYAIEHNHDEHNHIEDHNHLGDQNEQQKALYGENQ